MYKEDNKKTSKNGADCDFTKPEFYDNRELSWIEFNRRVFSEALDNTLPLLERLKFLSITSSNLDEFVILILS